ncbi:MAG: response regulator transcription factor [Candidatus Obscuribacter sp.]|nr:response regulator transcription factor [Candidatus Melainabacteria bacterium]MDX1989637.1 response regulator transcription factor [Candidatus Obscuribacter sp.]
MAKILLVEDDKELSEQLSAWFASEGHLLEVAATGEDAVQLLRCFPYDVLLLDWTLPGLSGLDVCKAYIHTGGLAKIIFLTGRGDIVDKESALDLGADDYVTKPFEVRELAARVRSVLRRPGGTGPCHLQFGSIVLDPALRTVCCGDRIERLMKREALILEFMMRHPNRVYSSLELSKQLWSSAEEVTPETVRSWMRNLRTKLRAVGAGEVIKTIPRTGYVLEGR